MKANSGVNSQSRIRREVPHDKKVVCGERFVATLSQQLVHEYGSGFTEIEKSLGRMVRFAKPFPDQVSGENT
ncbi:hypothetical protein [Propionivibrio sp.]|uniref:hypothetical protein n=1 Tax=Propionivibrio sp. TaxID=2212460 RepID=UPI003BF3B7D4